MFDDLIGNNNVKAILKRLAMADRVPRSLLFAGNEGVGKKEFALETTRSLVCRAPVDGGSCGECASCKRVANFIFPKPDDRDEHKKVIFSEHPDVAMVIPYGRNILVDAVRDLEREANFRPYEAKARVFIVNDAEKMNDNASNALLKTLEEPPPTTYIFLVTSQPDSLLATIRSRCQMLRFAPVAASEIEQYLVSKRNLQREDAQLSARLSNGSVGRAASIDLKNVRAAREAMLSVLRAILLDHNDAAMLRIAEKMNDAANKDNYEENMDILQTLIHDVWLIGLRAGGEKLVNGDIESDLVTLAKVADAPRLAHWLREIETMREGLAVNINRKIATDALFVTMAAS